MPHDLPPDPLAEERDPPHALPRGTLLNDKFRLQRVIGVGGFGIVYLAHDEMSDVDVAIKEYMPTSLAGRTKTMQVSLTSQSNAETFALGLKSFWNEARLLAKFRDEHLPLLKVYDAFQANGTAYMVMPVLRGRTAYQVRRDMPKPPSERWLRTLMTDLLPALERLHAENVYHRDIAPDNIQIDIHAKPVLMDLGAARHVISNRTQSITAILKPGYAPIEQYGENEKLRQGPWTDIYALGATLHFLLLNKAPSSATSRMFDTGVPLADQDLPGCSPAFLRVIDWMLAVKPEDRPQNVAQLRTALDDSDPTTRIMAPKTAPPAAARSVPAAAAAAAPAAPTAAATPTLPTQMAPPATAMARAPAPKVAAPPSAAAMATATLLPTQASPRPPAPQTLPTAPTSARAAIFGQPAHAAAPAGSDRALMPMLLAGAAALVLVVGAAVWLWPSETPPAAASARPSTGSAPAAAQATPAAPAVEPRRAEPVVLPATATVASPTTPPVGAAGPVVAPAPPPKLEPAAPPPAPAPAPTAVVKAEEASTTTAAAVPGKRASAPAATPAAGKKAALVNDKDGALLPKAQEPAPVAVAPAPPPPPPAPAPAPTPVAAPAAPTIASPSDRCSDKDGFARKLCVSLVCGVPELHNHPECVAIRRR